jgi:arylsulfatase A-like enzyme
MRRICTDSEDLAMRRSLIAGLLAAGLIAVPAAAHAQPKGKKPPNVLYIMSDDHASAAIGCYGSWLGKYAKTPRLDRLAKRGMRFTNCCVTNSICTPSRAAILTGQYSHKNGVYTLNDALDPTRRHLAHWLRAAGYQTAIIGKWHLLSDPTGFDYWAILPGQGQYHDPKLRVIGAKPKEFTVYNGGYSEDVITDLSLEWLKKRDKDKPFVLFCHYKAPHRPWDPAKRYADLFKDDKLPEPPSLGDNLKGRARAIQGTKMTIGRDMEDRDLQMKIPRDMPPEELRAWAYQYYMKRYLACVAAVDENVGRLLDFLEQEGLSEDTIVIYTSDQGFFLGEHGFFDKRLIYEPSLTTPLIIRYPGVVKADSVNNDLVLNIDHAPTFLELAGSPIPTEVQGRSYKALLQGKTPADWPRTMYYRYWMHLDPSHHAPAHYGVRTERYTLVYYYGKALGMKGAKNVDLDPEWELFDRQKDPQQLRNVYGDPAYADAIRELRGELDRLRKHYGDQK